MTQICNPLVTRIADKLIQFLEVTAVPDKDAIEIVMAFHTTIRAVLMGRVTGSRGKHGDELMQALEDACLRYAEALLVPASPRCFVRPLCVVNAPTLPIVCLRSQCHEAVGDSRSCGGAGA